MVITTPIVHLEIILEKKAGKKFVTVAAVYHVAKVSIKLESVPGSTLGISVGTVLVVTRVIESE